MPRVVRSPAALSDLTEIWRYIAAASPADADRFLDRIDRKCRILAEHPYMGRRREELAPNVHSFPIDSYIVFYRPIDDGIEIVRLIHGARDIEAEF